MYAKIEQGNIPQKRENVNSEPLIGEVRAVVYNIACSASRFSDAPVFYGLFGGTVPDCSLIPDERALLTDEREKVWAVQLNAA